MKKALTFFLFSLIIPSFFSQGMDSYKLQLGISNQKVSYGLTPNFVDPTNDAESDYSFQDRNFSLLELSGSMEKILRSKLLWTTEFGLGMGFNHKSTYNCFDEEDEEFETYIAKERLLSVKLKYGINYFLFGDMFSELTFFVNGSMGIGFKFLRAQIDLNSLDDDFLINNYNQLNSEVDWHNDSFTFNRKGKSLIESFNLEINVGAFVQKKIQTNMCVVGGIEVQPVLLNAGGYDSFKNKYGILLSIGLRQFL